MRMSLTSTMTYSPSRRPWILLPSLLLLLSLTQQSLSQDDLPKLRLGIIRPNTPQFGTSYRYFNNWVSLYSYTYWPEEYPLVQNYTLETTRPAELWQYSPREILTKICDSVISTGANALLFVQGSGQESRQTAERYLLQMTAFLGLPVLAYAGEIQPSPQASVLQISPSIKHQCLAMMSLLERYDWRRFSVVTGALQGSTFFRETLRELVDSHPSGRYELLDTVELTSLKQASLDEKLTKLRKSETRVILFYATEKEAEAIFSMAKEKELCGEEYIWIVSKSVIADQVQLRQENSRGSKEYPPGLLAINYGVIEEEDPRSFNTKLINKNQRNAVRAATYIWVNAMNEMFKDLQGNMTDFPGTPGYRCDEDQTNMGFSPVFRKWAGGELLYDYMKKVVKEGDRDSPRFSFNEDGTLTDMHLTVYNLDVRHYWKKIGTWDTDKGLEINDITWPSNKTTPPEGRPSKYKVKVVTIQEEPYVVFSDPDPKYKETSCPVQAVLCRVGTQAEVDKDPENAKTNNKLYQCCSGLSIDLLILLSKSIGFDFDLYEVEDKIWGKYNNKTGKWQGLIGDIISEKADMVMTSLTVTPERSEVIDFSIPYLETGISIVVAVRDGVVSPTAFLEPFDIICWLFILMACNVLASIAIFIFEWMSPSGYNLNKTPVDPDHQFSMCRSFWLIWAMLFAASVDVDNPKGMSSRFMANVWALFALIFTASYTANLAAFMITKEDYHRLSGINDSRLTHPRNHQPTLKFATMPGGSTEAKIIKNYPKMYQYMDEYSKPSVLEGVNAVKSKDIDAFIYDAKTLEYRAAHDDLCKLRTVGKWYAMTGFAIGLPKKSKWLARVDKWLAKYQYDGELERLQKFWLAGACTKMEGETSKPLGVLNFTSAFVLLAGGMLLSTICVIIEHAYFKFFRRKLKFWDTCGLCGMFSASMGKSLTWENTLSQALEMHHKNKCSNPICDTELWKLKHELDLALIKIEKMQRRAQNRAKWRDASGPKMLKPAVPKKPTLALRSIIEENDLGRTDPAAARPETTPPPGHRGGELGPHRNTAQHIPLNPDSSWGNSNGTYVELPNVTAAPVVIEQPMTSPVNEHMPSANEQVRATPVNEHVRAPPVDEDARAPPPANEDMRTPAYNEGFRAPTRRDSNRGTSRNDVRRPSTLESSPRTRYPDVTQYASVQPQESVDSSYYSEPIDAVEKETVL